MRQYTTVIIMVSYRSMINLCRQGIIRIKKNQHECQQKVKHRGNNGLQNHSQIFSKHAAYKNDKYRLSELNLVFTE